MDIITGIGKCVKKRNSKNLYGDFPQKWNFFLVRNGKKWYNNRKAVIILSLLPFPTLQAEPERYHIPLYIFQKFSGKEVHI
jgi:hypothetical protein